MVLNDDTPRTDACIDACMQKNEGQGKRATLQYFQAVHQDLAPLARQLERELAAAQTSLAAETARANAMATVAERLEKERDEARRDAERLWHLMARHKLALYRMVTGDSYQGVLAGTDEYRTRLRAAIDAGMGE